MYFFQFPFSDYYKEYKKLGGKKSKNQYQKMTDVFFEETLSIFVDGNPIRHSSREKAVKAVIKKLKISVVEFNKIFESIDNITAYT